MQASLADLKSEFCQILGLQDEESIVFISENGEDVTDGSISRFAEENINIFAYNLNLVTKDTLYTSELTKDIHGLINLDFLAVAADQGPISESIDDQIKAFEENIANIYAHVSELLRYERSLQKFFEFLVLRHSNIERSLRAARDNLLRHQLSISLRKKQELVRIESFLQKAERYISRFLADFTIMKKLPIDRGVFSLNDCKELSYLSELTNPNWEVHFEKLTEIKRSIEFSKSLLIAGNEVTLDEIPYCEVVLPQFDTIGKPISATITELEAEITSISSGFLIILSIGINEARKYMALPAANNPSIILKSSKILKLADITGRLTSSFFREKIISIRGMARSLIDLQGTLNDFQTHQRQCLHYFTKKEIKLVEIVQELEMIDNHTKDAAAIFAGLDEAHKFPREYIALLAEYFNRSIFVKNLKKSFSDLELRFAKILEDENNRRKNVVRLQELLARASILDEYSAEKKIDGNIVLFLSDEDSCYNGYYFEIKHRLENELVALHHDDPLRIQVELFLADMNQIFKAAATPVTEFFAFALYFQVDTSFSQNTLLQEWREPQITDDRDVSCEASDISRTKLKALHRHRERNSENLDDAYECNVIGEGLISKLQQLETKSKDVITIRNFQIGDVVLVLPTIRKGIWSLFNINSPHYFLHRESFDLIDSCNGTTDWAVGRISRIEQSESTGKKGNPYRIPSGMKYYNVWAEQLDTKAKSSIEDVQKIESLSLH